MPIAQGRSCASCSIAHCHPFLPFFFFLPRTGSLRVITNHSQSSLSFSQLYINFFVKIYKISSRRGSKISPLYFSHSNYYVEKYPFQSRLPCSTSLTRFIEAVPSCWESFFLNRFIQMFLSVLVGTDAWNSCRDLCLNELYYPRTQRHFLVCPFSLFFFFFFFYMIPYFVGIRTSSLHVLERELGTLFLVPTPSENLVQSVSTTAVTTGNCRPCICDKL